MERFKEWLSEWMDYLSDQPACAAYSSYGCLGMGSRIAFRG